MPDYWDFLPKARKPQFQASTKDDHVEIGGRCYVCGVPTMVSERAYPNDPADSAWSKVMRPVCSQHAYPPPTPDASLLRELELLLLSARRYVHAYAYSSNLKNHPQARESAGDLIDQIDAVLVRARKEGVA